MMRDEPAVAIGVLVVVSAFAPQRCASVSMLGAAAGRDYDDTRSPPDQTPTDR